MSDEGVRLAMRVALVVFLLVVAAFFRVFVEPGRRGDRAMLAGTLGGISSGVLLSYPIHTWFDVEASALFGFPRHGPGLGSSLVFGKTDSERCKLTHYRGVSLDTGRGVGAKMIAYMIRLLTGSTAPLASMCQFHATAVASEAVRPSLAMPRAYRSTRTG